MADERSRGRATGPLLRLSEHETALEVGWLLAELEQRFGYSLDELARRFDRSVSWVSRRLALVEVLPEAIQQQVREGQILAQVALKFLVPVARQNLEDCQRDHHPAILRRPVRAAQEIGDVPDDITVFFEGFEVFHEWVGLSRARPKKLMSTSRPPYVLTNFSDCTNMPPDPQHSPSARRLLGAHCRAGMLNRARRFCTSISNLATINNDSWRYHIAVGCLDATDRRHDGVVPP
jgi:hypothetical protein